MKQRRGAIALALVLFLTCCVSAQTVNFTSNTPANNGESVLSLIIEANLTNFNDLALLKRNLNGTNVTVYNSSRTKILWNFDNVSALGENSTKVVDMVRGISNITSLNANITGGSDCKKNGCLDFNSTQNGTVIYNSSQTINNSFTISLWMYPRNGGTGATYSYVIFQGNQDSVGGGWSIAHNKVNNRTFFFYRFYNNSGGDLIFTDANSVPFNTWSHVTIMGNSTAIYSFVNGVKQSTTKPNSGIHASTNDFYMGTTGSQLNTYDGRVDEFMVMNASLTATEIGELYNSTFLSKTAPGNYTYYRNYTSIGLGLYNYQMFATNTSTEVASEQRNVTIVSTPTVVLQKNVNFTSNTPSNDSDSIQSLTIEANLTNFNDLTMVKKNFNGTNVTVYNFTGTNLMWNFDNVSALGENSTKIVDIARGVNNVTSFTGTILNSTNCKHNTCIDLNGSQGGIVTHNSTQTFNNSFTISAWIYPRDGGTGATYDQILWKGNYFSSTGGWGLAYRRSNDRFFFFYRFYNNSDGLFTYTNDLEALPNTWHHVAVVGNSSGIFMFLNGVRQSNVVSNPGIYPNTEDMRIGNREGSLEMFDGRIDEVIIMNRSLSATEIVELYNETYLSKVADGNYTYYRYYNALLNGNYTYQVFATNTSTEVASEQRTIRITAPTITLNYPFDRVVVQKDSSNNGLVIINATVSQYPINMSIDANGTTTDYYSSDGLILTNITLPKGAHNITLRVNETPSVNKTALVGVGDVIVVTGQSNAVDTVSGYTTSYTSPYWVWHVHTDVFPTAWNNYTWESMSNSRRWSELAYYAAEKEQQPVMVINYAVGGVSITALTPGAAYYGYGLQQINYFTGGTMRVKGFLFNQGETDIINAMSESTYLSHLNSIITNFTTTMNVTTNESVIYQSLKAGNDSVSPDHVRKAQQRSWTEITNARRGATFYDIYLGLNEVHPTGDVIPYYGRRLSLAGIEQLYDNSTYAPPEVSSVKRINSTAIRVNYTIPVEISNYTYDSGSKGYGYVVTLDSGANLTDNNVTSTVLSEDNLSLVVNFDSDISDAVNVSVCTGFTCYGKAIARGLSNDLPALILFDTTLSPEDQTAPIVSVTSPTEGQTLTSSTVSISLTLDEIGSCNYSLNSGTNNVTMDTSNNLTFTGSNSSLADGSHTIKFYCTDAIGNTNNSKNVSFTVDTSEDDESDTRTQSEWSHTERNSEEFGEQKEIDVTLREKYRVELTHKGKKHHVGILKISSDSVKIEVASRVQEATLKVGEEKKFDIDEDKIYDLLVRLESIQLYSANVRISYIQESMVHSGSEVVEEVSDIEVPQPASEDVSDRDSLAFVIVLAIVVAALIVLTILLRKYHKKTPKFKGHKFR